MTLEGYYTFADMFGGVTSEGKGCCMFISWEKKKN